jgi:hypothetical protein
MSAFGQSRDAEGEWRPRTLGLVDEQVDRVGSAPSRRRQRRPGWWFPHEQCEAADGQGRSHCSVECRAVAGVLGRTCGDLCSAAALCSSAALSESHHRRHSCREAKDHTSVMPARPTAKQLRSLIVR